MAAESVDQNRDRFRECLDHSVIFITGGSGFVGKVFIEKVLRVMDVKKIFVLMRAKKGKSPVERFDSVFGNPLFDSVKKLKGEEIMKKIHIITGDCAHPQLGLSEEDRKLITEESEFIFHSAATIRFDEDLRPAVLLNVRGTKLMLELAKECKKLRLFCHLSTSYCHLKERILFEKAYPPPVDPHIMIRTCELLSQEVVNTIAPKILKEWPNSYAFTKSLAEDLVNAEMDKLPIILLRPSIIMPIWLEPIPGWTDNLNGPMGLLIAAGKGVLRTMYCFGDVYADYIPVDLVVNSMFACVTNVVILQNKQKIYNITSSGEYKITFQEIIQIGRDVVQTKLPFNGVFWYPGGSIKKCRFRHNLAFFFTQWVPAVLVDILLVVVRYPPVLKRVQRRILKGYEVFEYYTNKQWDFDNEESLKARSLLTVKERQTYRLDGEGINYEEYFLNCIHSCRLYILNEPDDTIPSAKRHMRVMWWADKIWMTCLTVLLFYFIWKIVLFLDIF